MRLLFVRFLGRLAEARARVETSGLRLVAVVLVLAALEAFGRVSPSDWVDGIGVALLASSAGLLFATRAEPWKRRGRALRALARRVLLPARLRYGLDLRGAPPLSEAVPWRTVGAGAASLAVLALLWATRDAFPGPAREALRTISGLLWLALLGLSWAALGFVVLATWFVLAAFLRRETRDLRSARGIAFALFGAVVLAAPRLPARWALAAALLTALVFALVLALTAREVRVCWRYASVAGQGAAERWSRFGPLEGGSALWFVTLALVPCVLAVGERFDGGGTGATSASALFGAIALWFVAACLALFFGVSAVQLLACRRNDPARPVRTSVHVAGAGSRSERRRIRAALAAAGFDTLFRVDARRVCVGVRLCAPGELRDARWPLALSIDDFSDPAVHARLARRDVVQRRRALGHRLGNLLRDAGRRDFARGAGYWIAPHLWLATHLTRDQDEEDELPLSPPYRRALQLAARSHLARVLADLELDLLFVEDGVGARRFRRVLALLFEYHDLFGARPCRDERHFVGLPGVRVLIHEVGLDPQPPRASYPEPEHEDIGRARILHVFVDRGDPGERVELPLDRDRLPAAPRPAPALL